MSALGRSTEYRYERPDAAMLESFPNVHSGYAVALDCAEFTSLCPVTGQPDFGRVIIEYVPADRCVESKSLKLYLGAYRNHGAFSEDCVNRIADDLVAAIAPSYLRVTGEFNVRGGIAIRPLAIRSAPGLSATERAGFEALVAQL